MKKIRIECGGGGGYSRGKTIECGGGKRQERRGIIRCLQWTMKGEGNRTCIMLLLSNLESRMSFCSFLRQHESTKNLFFVFSQPIKTQDIHRPGNSQITCQTNFKNHLTIAHDLKIPLYFIHEMKTKCFDVCGVNKDFKIKRRDRYENVEKTGLISNVNVKV